MQEIAKSLKWDLFCLHNVSHEELCGKGITFTLKEKLGDWIRKLSENSATSCHPYVSVLYFIPVVLVYTFHREKNANPCLMKTDYDKCSL